MIGGSIIKVFERGGAQGDQEVNDDHHGFGDCGDNCTAVLRVSSGTVVVDNVVKRGSFLFSMLGATFDMVFFLFSWLCRHHHY